MAIYQDTQISSTKVLYISGQTPNQGEELSLDINEQVDVVLQKIITILKNNNLSITNLVKMTIYITDREYLPAIRERISLAFKDHKPTCTLVVVAGLVNEKFKVEIDGIASI